MELFYNKQNRTLKGITAPIWEKTLELEKSTLLREPQSSKELHADKLSWLSTHNCTLVLLPTISTTNINNPSYWICPQSSQTVRKPQEKLRIFFYWAEGSRFTSLPSLFLLFISLPSVVGDGASMPHPHPTLPQISMGKTTADPYIS